MSEYKLEVKMWDLVLDMGFTSSAGLAREWILDGKVAVDGVVVKDNKALVTVTDATFVELNDPAIDMYTKMAVDNCHPAFIRRKHLGK